MPSPLHLVEYVTSTNGTCVARQALANIVIHLVEASAIVLARPRSTFIDVHLTMVALKARHTETAVPIDPVQANGAVLAWPGSTFIYILLAVVALIARLALADVLPSTPHAGPVVVAGVAGAKGGCFRPAIVVSTLALAAISSSHFYTLQMRLQTRTALTMVNINAAAMSYQVQTTAAGIGQVASDASANPVRWAWMSGTRII